MTNHGIASIGVRLPSLVLPATELAELRGIDPNKFTVGLGCDQIALCDAPDETVVDLAAEAARRAIRRWGGDTSRLGLVAVGTETAADMSRPLSAFVADKIGLKGHHRSYEVKHACYGGTLALRQALEWRASGAARGQAALVIAADVALYAEKDPGEPTQGAGAVAFIVDDPRIASVDLDSYAYAEPVFDFWRPVGERFPRVEGQLSLDSYMKAAEKCFGGLLEGRDAKATLQGFDAIAFHVPFPKMVKKATVHVCEQLGWNEQETAALFEEKVVPTMQLNRKVGNAYTASLWLSVVSALAGAKKNGQFAAFSYGSGFGSELLTLRATDGAEAGAWMEDVRSDLEQRRSIDKDEYVALRQR